MSEKLAAGSQAGRTGPGQLVKVVNEKLQPYTGQAGKVKMIYYDIHHTGSSPDLLLIEMSDGVTIRALSTSIESM